MEATTKSGKTVSCMAWLTEKSLVDGADGKNYWWVAPIGAQAKIAMRRIIRGLPDSIFTTNESENTITFANGAVMWFKSADNPDSLYGEDVYAAVVDEASRCKEQSWYAVRSTLTATRGPCRIIGNVRGRKNWAYKLARRAEAGAPDMAYAKITAYDAVDAGVLAAEEVQDAKDLLPDHVFKELYLAEASDDGSNPFGLEAIAACVRPLSALTPVAWGWDIAKSNDFVVGIGLDRRGHVCRFERWNMHQLPPGIAPGTTYWDATIRRIRQCTGNARALIDSTGMGDAVYEAVAKHRPRCEPYQFTAPSKQKLMEGLAVAIQRQKVGIPHDDKRPTAPYNVIRGELESFEYVVNRTSVQYAAPEGLFDDCVMSLGLAVLALGNGPAVTITRPGVLAGAGVKGW